MENFGRKLNKIPRPDGLNSKMENMAVDILKNIKTKPIYVPEKSLGKLLEKFSQDGKSKKNKKIIELQSKWEQIIGIEFAKICYPEAISGKTLKIRANSGAAAILEMRSNEILGLASLACGTSLNKLSIIAVNIKNKIDTENKRPLKPLSPKQKREFEKKLTHISSQKLKNALFKLETYIQNQND